MVLSDEKAVVEEDRRRSPTATSAGWSRSGWSPRASTCRAWPSASTPRRRRRRCSSPRPSAASCAPASAARPRRCSCRRCRTCSGFASEMEVAARPRAGPPGSTTRTTSSPPRTTCSPRPTPSEAASAELEMLVRGARARRRRFDRVLYDGGEFGHAGEVHVGLGGGDGLPRHPRACSSPTRCASCCTRGRASGPASRRPRAAPRRRHGRRRSPPTSSSPCCGASSTAWSPPGTTAPARRTASPTPRCARSAAARRRRSPPPTSCTSGSTGSASGRARKSS